MISPAQVNAPVELLIVHPVAADPPANSTSPVEVAPIWTFPEPLPLIAKAILVSEPLPSAAIATPFPVALARKLKPLIAELTEVTEKIDLAAC